MLQEQESDGNEPEMCLMHNYHRMSMLRHNHGDDVGLNEQVLKIGIIFLIRISVFKKFGPYLLSRGSHYMLN